MLARGRLAEDPALASALFKAGDRLREAAHRADRHGAAVIDLAAVRGGAAASATPLTEAVLAARQFLEAAQARMDADAWFAVEAIVIREQTLEETGRQCSTGNAQGANAVALDRLRRGLTTLAASWELLPI
jgi:hypothetical protein